MTSEGTARSGAERDRTRPDLPEPDWLAAEREYDDEVVGRTTIPRLFEESAARHVDRPAQGYKGGVYDRSLAPGVLPPAPDGAFASLSYGEFRAVVRNLAAGFRELGVRPDDRVAIFADTRMEWAQADFALLAAGGVVTTVYAGSSVGMVHYLLRDPDADGVVVENDDALDRVLAAAGEESPAERPPDLDGSLDLSFVVAMDEVDDRGREDVYTLAEVHDLGAAAFDREAYESWIDGRDPDDLASLIYTSGTTGRPKGVRLTHRNFRSNLDQVRRRFGPRPDRDPAVPTISPESRAVSYLPLAHVFERLSGHFFTFASGAQVAYAESPDTLQEDFRLVEPTVATSVPRVYERMYEAIRAEAESSAVGSRVFSWATAVGRASHEADEPGAWLRAKRWLADRLVFRSVREALGGEVELFISGGGSLSAELCALYHGMGLPVLEGYGLTETSPVVSANPPEAPEVGTIGPPVVDVEVRLDESVATGEQRRAADGAVGELEVRGPNVTDGYWNVPEATGSAFTGDGWFRTGDVVELRPDGYLAFVERAKQILTLSTGKNVAPGPIEDAFASEELVEQVMVVGDSRKFVGAVVVPNLRAVRRWADREGVDLPDDDRAVCRDDRVEERVGEVVARANRAFEEHERIKQFRLVPEEFTEDNDLLTPTLKKKRRNIADRYADEIADIYAE